MPGLASDGEKVCFSKWKFQHVLHVFLPKESKHRGVSGKARRGGWREFKTRKSSEESKNSIDPIPHDHHPPTRFGATWPRESQAAQEPAPKRGLHKRPN